MDRAFTIRRRRGLRGLGYPIIPDQFTTAGGVPEAFSPKTADATIVQILQQQGQQLPAALASAMAAGTPSTTYVAPNQSPISSSVNVAPGVWQWTRVDGTTFYGDANQNPVSYTPAAVTPAGGVVPLPPAISTPVTTPAPPAVVTTPVVTPIVPGTPALTPSGTLISTTTGTPATSGTVVAAAESSLDSLMSWLEGSMIGGIPNWLLLGGAVAGLMMFGGDGGSSSRRRR
jgi:hypothetical protein